MTYAVGLTIIMCCCFRHEDTESPTCVATWTETQLAPFIANWAFVPETFGWFIGSFKYQTNKIFLRKKGECNDNTSNAGMGEIWMSTRSIAPTTSAIEVEPFTSCYFCLFDFETTTWICTSSRESSIMTWIIEFVIHFIFLLPNIALGNWTVNAGIKKNFFDAAHSNRIFSQNIQSALCLLRGRGRH